MFSSTSLLREGNRRGYFIHLFKTLFFLGAYCEDKRHGRSLVEEKELLCLLVIVNHASDVLFCVGWTEPCYNT